MGAKDSQGFGADLHTLLYLKWVTNSTSQGILLHVMWQPGWEGSLGENGYMYTCIRVAESLCCLPETITTLLISCTPIQNKKVLKK